MIDFKKMFKSPKFAVKPVHSNRSGSELRASAASAASAASVAAADER